VRTFLAIAAVLNLLSCFSYFFVAKRIHQKAYLQGRKDESKYWLELEEQVGTEREKIWREES
jgi:hypothetical protein